MMAVAHSPSDVSAAAVVYALIDPKKLLTLSFPVLFHNTAFYSSEDSKKSKLLEPILRQLQIFPVTPR